MSSQIPHKYTGNVGGTVINLASRGAQNLRFVQALNSAQIGYIQIFNLPSTSVTIGTTVPVQSFGVPSSAAIVIPLPEDGLLLGGDGMSVACTTTRGGLTSALMDINIGWGN